MDLHDYVLTALGTGRIVQTNSLGDRLVRVTVALDGRGETSFLVDAILAVL